MSRVVETTGSGVASTTSTGVTSGVLLTTVHSSSSTSSLFSSGVEAFENEEEQWEMVSSSVEEEMDFGCEGKL
jgi:hypothetical protein